MKRLTAVALLLVAAACSKPVPAKVDDPTPATLMVHLLALDQGGSARMTFGGVEQRGAEGSNCWSSASAKGQGVTRCVDTVSDVQAPTDFVSIPPATPILIVGDAGKAEGAVAKVIREHGQISLKVVQKLDLSGGHAVIDVPPGSYTLEIIGTWKQGTVSFYFGVRVS